jgi:hypothetical protein
MMLCCVTHESYLLHRPGLGPEGSDESMGDNDLDFAMETMD